MPKNRQPECSRPVVARKPRARHSIVIDNGGVLRSAPGMRTSEGRPWPVALLAVIGFAVVVGCEGPSYVHVGDADRNREITRLLAVLDSPESSPERRFVAVGEVSRILAAEGRRPRQLLFLTSYVEDHPRDPYNAYYLAIVAATYRDGGAVPVAVHYYDRILKNHPDLLIDGRSIHLTCLDALIDLVDTPERQVVYYKEIIGRFPDDIDLGLSHYYLARAYEQLGEWEQAIQAYATFLQYPEAEIPGHPNAYLTIKEKVDFHYSDKSWVVRDLDTLVRLVTDAMSRRDTVTLRRLQAKRYFFTTSWEQREATDQVVAPFDLSSFSLFRVRFDQSLDVDSNAREAYLRTTGWSHRIQTWYLYFRRIDYRFDPEYDGLWEWAGIYFGEKL